MKAWRHVFVLSIALLATACATLDQSQPSRVEATIPLYEDAIRNFAPGDRSWRFDLADMLAAPPFRAPAKAVTSYTLPWERIGPVNWAGKVMDLDVASSDSARVVAAFANGGLWQTFDNGLHWQQLNDRLTYNHFSSVHYWRTDPQTIFAGLGVPGSVFTVERGILRSTDGGNSWSNIGPDVDGVYRIVASPGNADHIWAATTSSIQRTTDGGSNWIEALSYSGNNWWNEMPDLVQHPSDANTLWAAQRKLGLWKTTDGGTVWTDSDVGIDVPPVDDGSGAIVLAVAPSNPLRLYAEREMGPSDIRVFRSTDGGAIWTLIDTLATFHQGRYDMSIAVDPANENHVIIGNVTLHQSTNGSTFVNDGWNGAIPATDVPQPAAHADHLRSVIAPSDPSVIWNGNDGGIWRSDDGGDTWVRPDRGIYGNVSFNMGIDPNSEAIFLSSADYTAGQLYLGGHEWGSVPGYEWQFYAVDPQQSSVVYSEFSSRVRRSTDRGLLWVDVDPEPSGNHPYGRTMAFDPIDSSIVYLSTDRIYRSTNRGDAWSEASPALVDNVSGSILSFAVADSDGDVMVSVSDELWRTGNGGANWQPISPVPAYMQTVAISPSDPSVFYVGAVWDLVRYSAGGTASTSIRSNLPDSPVRRIAIDAENPGRLIILNDIGVYISDNDGESWQQLGTGLPLVTAWDLALRDGQVYVAGSQGVWRFDLRCSSCMVHNGFTESSGLTFNGNALVDKDALAVVPAMAWGRGSVWASTKLPVAGGFETQFRFRIVTDLANSADGLAFVIQNAGTSSLGVGGTAMGYASGSEASADGIPSSLAVELDTYQSPGETSNNHVSIQTNGAGANHWEPTFSLASIVSPVDLDDGKIHELRITYEPGTMTVFLDDFESPLLVVPLDLNDIGGDSVVDGSGRAWLGFTSGTGGWDHQTHEVLSWSFRDLAGNIFADDFESADSTAWSATAP